MNILGIDHIEMYVGDARQAAYVLCTAFGFRVCGQGGPETGLAGQRILLLGQGDIRILLTSGLQADHPATEYVSRHGDGVAVVAFGTDDVAERVRDGGRRRRHRLAAPRTYADGDEQGRHGHRLRLRRRRAPAGRAAAARGGSSCPARST